MLRLALAAAAACLLLLPGNALAAAGHVVVSQAYGGGGNSNAVYTNDFVELFNPTAAPVSVDGWSIQYASATGSGNFGSTATQITPLSGTIQPGHYLLVQEAAGSSTFAALPTPDLTDTSPINIAGGGGKVALVSDATPLGCNGGTTACSPAQLARIVDLVGWDGANFYEGAPAPGTQNWTAVIRADGGCTDTDSNAADFTAATPTPRNSATTPHSCLGVAISCGSGITTPAGFSGSATVTASQEGGTVVAIDLTGPAGITRTAFTPAAAPGGTATAEVTAAATLAPGDYTAHLTAANAETPPATAGCDLPVHVMPVLPIGTVQGSVPDGADGGSFASPYAGQVVTVRGVVTEKTAEGGNGFFLQNTPDTADGDQTSSDGIFVYIGGYADLLPTHYVPQVGDEIVLSGRVSEYYGNTELGSPRIVQVVSHGSVVTPFAASPPADAAAAAVYWERHEGELASLAAGSSIDSPVHYYASSGDTEFYALAPDSPVSGRTDPYARRAFRPAHQLAGAGASRVLVTDEGIKALFGPGTRLVPVHTFETLTAPTLGAVTYAFSKYSLAAAAQPEVAPGPNPYDNAPPAAFDRGKAYSIVNYNLENLYDYVNDPTDGCDFATDSGCPGVDPPFDYVPASDAEYRARVDEIAHQIVTYLHAPDVLAVMEIEDEDLNHDGQPDPLEDLEAAIAAAGGPSYHAGFDRDGADARGIVSAFLWRTDRVELLPAFHAPAIDYPGAPLPTNGDVSNPLALNAVLPADAQAGADGANVFTRAAELAHFRIWRTAVGRSEYRDVWLVANHFASGPDTRVAQRREQAAYNAAIAKALEAAYPPARIDVLGDLNVYPRPDDPLSPPSDQLAPLYDTGLHNLWDTELAQNPASAYSYVYQGMAQTLDQQFVSPALFADLKAVNEAHVNSDWTPDVQNDGWHGTSDHDPTVARFDGRATLAGLRQLVLHYAETGQLNAHAEKGLLDRLDRAASFQASGQQNPYANQLHSFAQDATHGVPGEIDPVAGEALAAEAAAVLAG